jgi:hypothetical protein
MKRILFLAANPKDTSPLRLDEEVREIENGLQRAKERKQFALVQKWAVRPRDIRRAMLDVEPHIVHFSGHGASSEGLVFEDQETGYAKSIDIDALADLFSLFSDRVECVVLNACYSESQAQAISQHISYVVGMSKAVGDRAAIEFAVGFYDALGAGRSIEFAYKLGCNAIHLQGIPEHLTPILIKKTGESPLEAFDKQRLPSGLIDHYRKRTQSITLPAIEREFVGRKAEIALFDNTLSSPQKPILFFHGIGGIGKSWLVNRLISKCQDKQIALVDYNNTHMDFLDIIVTIQNQLSGSGFENFQKDLERNDFIRRAQTVQALKLLTTMKQPIFYEQSDTTDELLHYLSMPDAERMRMVQKVRGSLTASFVADLAELSQDRKCILFFDTVERIGTDTGDWLQNDLFPRLVSLQSENLLVVLAGRKESFLARLSREWKYHIEERELTSFDQFEVEQYLNSAGLGKPTSEVCELIYDFTRGHPLCVGLAVDLLAEYTLQGDKLDVTMLRAYKEDISSEIISGFLTQRILDRISSELSQLVMACSIPHWFDASIMRHLVIDTELSYAQSIDYLEKIKAFSFVRPYFEGRRGYGFHEVVRQFLLIKWRRDDLVMFRTLNKRALQYFEHELELAGDKVRSELLVEKVYHLLAVDENAGMALFSELFEQFDTMFKKDICKRLIDVASEHQWDEEKDKKWATLAQMFKQT